MFVFVNPISSEDDELALTGRQGRQQTGGDTYTLEIAFPAVKYVQAPHSDHDNDQLHPISSALSHPVLSLVSD